DRAGAARTRSPVAVVVPRTQRAGLPLTRGLQDRQGVRGAIALLNRAEGLSEISPLRLQLPYQPDRRCPELPPVRRDHSPTRGPAPRQQTHEKLSLPPQLHEGPSFWVWE